MDGDAGDLREALLDGVFKGGEDIVDAGDGEVALHDAMAGDEDVVFDLADADFVAVDEFVVSAGHGVEEVFDGGFELAHFAGANVGGGDVAAERLDVDVDVDIALAKFVDALFEFGGLAMSFAKAEVFVDFEVEFDEEMAVLLGGGNVVNGEAETKGDGANGFEEMLVARSARFGMDDDVGRNDLGDALFDFVGEHVDLFEIGGAGDADGGIHKIAIAGAAEADAFDVQNAVNAADGSHDFLLEAGGRGVKKRVEGAAAELRTDPENDASDGQAG